MSKTIFSFKVKEGKIRKKYAPAVKIHKRKDKDSMLDEQLKDYNKDEEDDNGYNS